MGGDQNRFALVARVWRAWLAAASGAKAGPARLAVLMATVASALALPASAQASTPSAFTGSVFATGATTARVEGSVNPGGESTQYHVAYDLASSEWCTSHGSKGSPTHATSPLTLGSTAPGFHAVSVGLSGLTAGSEYCEELIAANGSSTSAGSQQFFTAGTPSVRAFGPRATTSTNELVEGEVNPAGQSTQYHVAYDLASSEWCTSHGSKGSPGHSTSLVTLGSTAPNFRRVSVGLSGLTGGSEYCEELIAANASGTSSGFTQTFTAGAPSVEARGSRAIASTAELVNGQVNPAGQSTQYHVAYDLASSEWCTSRGSKGSPTHATSPLTLGSTASKSHPVSVGLSGLTAGSGYCEELIAANGSGTSAAFQQSFTAGTPSVNAFGTRAISSTNELVEGEVNPAGQSTQYHVAYDLASSEWCTSNGSKGSPAHATSPLTLGSTASKSHPVSVGLSGLTAGSGYCEELIAANGSGTSSGFTRTFTAGAPSAFAFGPQSTGTTTATVGGEVNPAGQSTQYHVAYDLAISEWCTSRGLVSSPAHSTAPVTLGFTDATSHQVSVELTALTGGSEYCVELIAVNGSGTSEGFQQSFTAGAPSAFAFGPQSTGATTATVAGQVNPSGQTTQYHVAYDLVSSEWCSSGGLAGSPAHSTSPVTLGFTDATFHQVSVELTALTGGSEYCVELIAVNGSGTSEGFPQSFTAGAPSAFASAPQPTGATTATVAGQVNPAGQTTQYHVAYDLASSEWCTSGGLAGSPAHSTTPVTLGFTDTTFHQVSVELTGLSAGNEYCAELIAVNGSGTGHVSAEFFFSGLPAASTSNAFATGATTAMVEGQVNPSGQTTQYHVAYDLASSEWCTSGGLAGSPAHATTPVTLDFTDATFHQVSVELTGLSAGNEYCVELIVANGSGTAHGSQVTFFAGFPAASTSNAFATGATTATVEGQVNPSGQTTQYHVAYDLAGSEWCASEGLAGSPAHSTTPATLGFTDAAFHQVSVELTGLSASNEYCVELVAVNGSGTAHGSQLRFTAAPPLPAVTKVSPASGTTAGGTLVTIIGTALEGATVVHFGAASATIKTNTATEITAESPAHAGGQVDVTVTTPGGTSATSEADHYSYVGVPEEITPPKISGTAQQGQTLTEEHGNWTNEPTSYKLQWLRCNGSGAECKAIEGSTGETYVVGEADVGGKIKVEERALNKTGESKPATSAATAEVLPHEPVDESPPKISGTAQQGKTLTEEHGIWKYKPTSYKVQWLRCGKLSSCLPISGAASQTYKLTALDIGETIRVHEIATNAGGESARAESEATAVVVAAVPEPIAPPKISGTAEKGQTLVEGHGTWTIEPTAYTYQWVRCNGAVKECAGISGAVNQTYEVTSADVGGTLVVQETAYNEGVPSLPSQSPATAVVTLIPLKAGAGENLHATTSVPVAFDGSGSSPAAEIDTYHWEFGDGSTSGEESPSHSYTAPGPYKATLTVFRGLERAEQSITVTVFAPAPHNVKVKVIDSGEHLIAGADVLYVGPEGVRIQATTGPEGEATLEGLPNGTDTVYAYKSGYEPLVGHVTVSGGTGAATLTLLTGEVATSTLKSRELTLPEIEALGINVHDPANQHVYEFEVRLAFIEGEPPKPLHGYINSNSEFVFPGGGSGGGGGGWTCSPNGCQGGGVVAVPAFIEGHPLIQWLILRGKATVLKQFFEVSMVIQNLSSEPFKLTGGSAALHLPPGISFAPTSTPQHETQAVNDVPGLGSKTVNWIIRGDTPGSYFLSADYHGKISILEAPVNLHAELAQPLVVWGANALALTVQADSGFLTAGVPYHVKIGVTNKADVPLYNVAVEIDANTHEHFIFQPEQHYGETVSELRPGQTAYAPEDILVPDGASESEFNPSLSSATFAGETIKPGAGIEAVTPPTLYPLSAPADTPNFVHLHWQASPGAEGYEVFSTPNLDTPFAGTPNSVFTATGSTEPVTVLPETATDAYLPAESSGSTEYYAVTTIIAKRATLDHPVIGAAGAPRKGPSFQLSVAHPGEHYVVTGSGWLPGETVAMYLDTAEGAHYIGVATANAVGNFGANVTDFLPAIAKPADVLFEASEKFPIVAMGNHGDAATITDMTDAEVAEGFTDKQSTSNTTDGGCGEKGAPLGAPSGIQGISPTAQELKGGLSTAGSEITYEHGKPIRLAGVNWYGAEETDSVPGGLQCRSIAAIAHDIRQLGFNTVRLPWSNAMLELNPRVCRVPSAPPQVAPIPWQPCIPPEVLSANGSLVHGGNSALTIFRATVKALEEAHLMVVLDNHGTDAAFEPVAIDAQKKDLDGLWWSGQYWDHQYGFGLGFRRRETHWITDWERMVKLFQGNPYVIGADLRNEPAETPYPCGSGSNCKAKWEAKWHKACIGGIDPRENWPCAAQRAGKAIIGLDHRLLIFVEGIEYGTEIPQEGLHHLLRFHNGKRSQLVYSAHTYSQDGTTFDKRWGYLVEQDKAPVWIGEFGDTAANHCSSPEPPSNWLKSAINYLAKVPASWSWWPINGTDSDGGIHYESERSYYGRESYGLLCASWDTEASESIMEELDGIMQER